MVNVCKGKMETKNESNDSILNAGGGGLAMYTGCLGAEQTLARQTPAP